MESRAEGQKEKNKKRKEDQGTEKQRYREKDGEMEKTVKIGMKRPAERWRNLEKTDRDRDGGRKRGTGRRTEKYGDGEHNIKTDGE